MKITEILYVTHKKSAINETTDDFGFLHSFDDEPSQILKNGNSRWSIRGVLHRDGDKPAQIVNSKNSRTEYYCINGLISRDGGKPAIVEIHQSKNIVLKETFYNNGALYRIKTYNEFGHLIKDAYQYYNNYGIANGRIGYNSFSNVEPTTITYYDTGEVKSKEWWFDNKLSRFDGPAKISFKKTGEEYNHIWRVHSSKSNLHNESIDKLLKLNALELL